MRASLVIAVVVSLLAVHAVHAEGTGGRERKASTAKRVYGASFVKPLAGGVVTVGGSTLRYLPPGATAWTTLHTRKGNLSRVAMDDANARLLAVWESDTELHYFTLRDKKHVVLKLPTLPAPTGTSIFYVYGVDFTPDGTAALVYYSGPLEIPGSQGEASRAFRIALDGKSAPTLLWEELGTGELQWTSPRGALYILPEVPGRRGHWKASMDGMLTAFIVDGDKVTRKAIYGGSKVKFRELRMASRSTPDHLAMHVRTGRGGDGLLSYKWGDAAATYQDLPPGPGLSGFVTVAPRGDELSYVVDKGKTLDLVRRAPPPATTTSAVSVWATGFRKDSRAGDRTLASFVYGFGVRADGSSWLHLGDDLALISADGATVKRVDLAKLVGGKPEWGGNMYLEKPEGLWIGVEVGPGRDYVWATFADLERRAAAWPARDDSVWPAPSPRPQQYNK